MLVDMGIVLLNEMFGDISNTYLKVEINNKA